MQEVWKDIEGYDGKYIINNNGDIISFSRKTPKKLKPVKHKNGYLFVGLSYKGKTKIFSVHRLVAQTFIPNPYNLPCVNHKDENKENNDMCNLEWCSWEYNCNYGTRAQRISKSKKGVKMSDEYKEICRRRQLGKRHSIETRKRMSESHKRRFSNS